jgi:hypothetical protein
MFSLWKGFGFGLVTIFWAGFLLGVIAALVVVIVAGHDKQNQKRPSPDSD